MIRNSCLNQVPSIIKYKIIYLPKIFLDNPYRFIVSETSSRIEKIFLFLSSQWTICIQHFFFFWNEVPEQQKFVLNWIWAIQVLYKYFVYSHVRTMSLHITYVIVHTYNAYREEKRLRLFWVQKYKYLGCIIV